MIHIYTDGSASSNPGPAGYSIVCLFPDHSISYFQESFYRSTNNRVELMAIIQAIEMFAPCNTITIHTDSMYCAAPIINGRIRTRKEQQLLKKPNCDLWIKVRDLLRLYGRNIEVVWLKGHNGNELNHLADELAGEAARAHKKKPDHGYGKRNSIQSLIDRRRI